MPRALKVCSTTGCPTLTDGRFCRSHARVSARNHRGVPRQAREHGASYDRLAREFAGQPCELRLDKGCTGIATGADLIIPRSRGGRAVRENAQPACLHCNASRGAREMRRPCRT